MPDPTIDRDTTVFEAGTSPQGRAGLTVEHCLDGLGEAGRRRQVAETLRAEALLDMADWIHAAHTVGIGPSEIAARAGVSRQHVRHVLVGRD